MINGFIWSRSVPKGPNVAIVRPIFKDGKPTSIENYCPISILPVLWHLSEKHLVLLMTSFLDRYPMYREGARSGSCMMSPIIWMQHLITCFHARFFFTFPRPLIPSVILFCWVNYASSASGVPFTSCSLICYLIDHNEFEFVLDWIP